jgi:hypothetical protein
MRPKINKAVKKIPVSLSLPYWLAEWMRTKQGEISRSDLITYAMETTYGLTEYKDKMIQACKQPVIREPK